MQLPILIVLTSMERDGGWHSDKFIKRQTGLRWRKRQTALRESLMYGFIEFDYKPVLESKPFVPIYRLNERGRSFLAGYRAYWAAKELLDTDEDAE